MDARAQSFPSPNGLEQHDSRSVYSAAGGDGGRKGVVALAIMTGLAVGGMASVGCTSDAGDTFAEYEGTWQTAADPALTNGFPLDCPERAEPIHRPYPLFTTVKLEPGTVSDLFDVAGPGSCRFAYEHVKGMKTLALVNPDPFTGAPVRCFIHQGERTDFESGDPVSTDLFITPTEWSFRLQPVSKGKPPLAQLVGKAVADIVDTAFDRATDVPRVLGSSPCTYSVIEYLEKVAKP